MDNMQWQTKVKVYFKTDTDNLNVVMYRYRSNLYLKDNGNVISWAQAFL